MALQDSFTRFLSNRFAIKKAENLSGGCINDCYCLYTDKGKYFIKLNSARAFPGMFTEEARALRLMASTSTVNVPEVIAVGEHEQTSYLLLNFIEPGSKQSETMSRLGRQVALMHQRTSKQFGFESDNYIGSLPQANNWKNNWAGFFVEMRLQPQLALARNKHLLSTTDANDFEKLFQKISALFPTERPALLHGDLWAGNYVVAKNGDAYLIDPAVYYGHREMDLAMASLF